MTPPVFKEAGLEVWRTSIKTEATSPETLSAMSAEDFARYERLRVPVEKNAFAESRRVLSLLVAQSALVPTNAKIIADDNGRPIFSGDTGAHISWSRSGPYLAASICTNGPVGLDIEYRREISHAAMLAMISGEDERAAFDEPSLTEQGAAFLRLWTIKEAVLKSMGTGFKTSPKLITVPREVYAETGNTQCTLACLDQRFRISLFEDTASVMCLACSV